MSKQWILLPMALCICLAGTAQKKKNKKEPTATAVETAKKEEEKPTVVSKTKGNTKHVGLFTIYQDTATGSLQMYIRKDQLGQEFIYQSFSNAGPTELYLNQGMHRSTFIFSLRKVFDKIEFAEQNTNFYYDTNSAINKAANVDHLDAILYNAKVDVEDSTGYLIAVDDLLMGENLDPIKPMADPEMPPGLMFNLGNLNTAKSKYDEIRSYPKNTDVIVELAYDNPMPINGGGKDITDARYNRVKIQHSFLAMPSTDFTPRLDDARVGFFTQEVDDLTSISAAPFKDVITRWKLVKKDPNAAISEPVEPITWWIENTTPLEYRQTIKEAGEKWNEAFEKAGFRNAVVMKIMPDTAKWNPADIQYNVIRWVSSSSPAYGAIGPSFTNPRTGQILGSDITVEWKSAAGAPPLFNDLYNTSKTTTQVPFNLQHNGLYCNMVHELAMQFTAGQTIAEVLDDDAAAEIATLHKQFLYYLILHEMGHTLGLNHNMKASQMLSPAELHNTNITHKIGLQGSVMDYPSINVALDRSKQGDYYTTKPGPYDLWAIEYGYKPFSPTQEAAGLAIITSRSNEPQLIFGNDADDMRAAGSGIDPRVMVNDLSNDMVAFADERFQLVNAMVTKLKDRYTRDDENYAKLRQRYAVLFRQRVDMASALSNYIGGVYVDRALPGSEPNVQPYTPVPKAYQQQALSLLSKYVFAPNAFDMDAALFPYLQQQRRGFGFFGSTEDPKPMRMISSLQGEAIERIVHPTTLSRLSNSSLYGNTYSVAELMNDLVADFFSADLKGDVNLYRQNLQTKFVDLAISMLSASPSNPYDNISKAAALATLKKIKSQLSTSVSKDATTQAHRASLVFSIDKALAVK